MEHFPCLGRSPTSLLPSAVCVQEPPQFPGNEPCSYFCLLLSLLLPLCVKGPNHVRCWPSPSRNCMPSRTWAVWHIPGDDMHLLGLIKQVTQLQWILSRNIFSVLQWEIFLFSWFLWTLKLAYLTHSRYCWPIGENFSPLLCPDSLRFCPHSAFSGQVKQSANRQLQPRKKREILP